MIHILILLSALASAEFTPLPASTPEATNSNFKAIDEEVRRLDASTAQLNESNSFNTAGTIQTFGSSVTVNGLTTANGPIIVSSMSYAGHNMLGAWYSWTPSYSGFSSNPTGGTAKYIKIGKTVIARLVGASAGTSNATTYTVTLPVVALEGISQAGMGWAMDGGTSQTAPCRLDTRLGSNIADVYKTLGAATWTNSGQKICEFTIWYEAQ